MSLYVVEGMVVRLTGGNVQDRLMDLSMRSNRREG